MIREIIDFVKFLKENSTFVFEKGLEPSKGLHILVELDENGNAKNFPGERGKDWDYYDGKNTSDFLKDIVEYEQYVKLINNDTNKCIDGNIKQILSCNAYCLAFKKEKINKIRQENLLDGYFKSAVDICNITDSGKELILRFKSFLKEKFFLLEEINSIKRDELIVVYLKMPIKEYEEAYKFYLKKKLFNSNKFNSQKEISDDTYGLSGFFNGMNSKKPFLQHKTAVMYKGVPERIRAEDTIYLNDFDVLLRRKIFPNPLPIFIDKREFKTTEQMVNIFNENKKLSFTQIIKKLFEENNNLLLENYYLLFF